ncbi:MAG: hypothetical protein EHM35_10865, partial [Planctomycetaceae bacterium]
MLSGGNIPSYRNILATNPRPIHRVEVWRSGVRIDDYGDEGVPILAGSVSATLNSRVTRQAELQVSDELFPADETGLLAPYGNELRIWAGVDGMGGRDRIWQVFRGKIQKTTLNTNVSIRASDRAEEILSDIFLAPVNSNVGTTVLEQFFDLITNSLPDATFGTSDELFNLVPKLTWESSRAAALDELANGSRAFWYALANGDFVMRRVPWSITSPALETFSDGENGTITSASIELSRENVSNVINVIGERSDGTPPVYALITDNNPSSPTWVDGAFGRKGLLIKTQTVTTPGQAAEVGEDSLLRHRTLTQSWTTTQVFDPSLELGDAILVQAHGRE